MPSKRRPRLVTCLSLIVLTYSAIQFTGLLEGMSLSALDLPVPKGYLLLKNGLWGLISALSAAALFFGWHIALQWSRGVVLLIGIWYWIDRLLCMRSDFIRSSWLAAMIVTLMIISMFYWITSWKSVKAYFRENNV